MDKTHVHKCAENDFIEGIHFASFFCVCECGAEYPSGEWQGFTPEKGH